MGDAKRIRAKEQVLQIFFPKTCPVCEEILEKHREICSKCEEKLQFVREPKCKKCGKPFEGTGEMQKIREYCGDCTKRMHFYEFGMAVFLYNDDIKESIYRFKYHNQRTYADFYGNAMAHRYGKTIKDLGIQALIPVPISRKKKTIRGYNQAELMARSLGRELNIPVDNEILERNRNTVPQKELNFEERRNNLKNAFKISRNGIEYNKILMVDDIYTTGSTIDACATALKNAGVREVYFISLSIGAGI